MVSWCCHVISLHLILRCFSPGLAPGWSSGQSDLQGLQVGPGGHLGEQGQCRVSTVLLPLPLGKCLHISQFPLGLVPAEEDLQR